LVDELLGVLLDELLEELLYGVLEELEEPLEVVEELFPELLEVELVEGAFCWVLERLFNQKWCALGPWNEWPTIGPPKVPPLKPWPTKPPPWAPRPLKKYPVPAPTPIWPPVAPAGWDALKSFLIAVRSLASV